MSAPSFVATRRTTGDSDNDRRPRRDHAARRRDHPVGRRHGATTPSSDRRQRPTAPVAGWRGAHERRPVHPGDAGQDRRLAGDPVRARGPRERRLHRDAQGRGRSHDPARQRAADRPLHGRRRHPPPERLRHRTTPDPTRTGSLTGSDDLELGTDTFSATPSGSATGSHTIDLDRPGLGDRQGDAQRHQGRRHQRRGQGRHRHRRRLVGRLRWRQPRSGTTDVRVDQSSIRIDIKAGKANGNGTVSLNLDGVQRHHPRQVRRQDVRPRSPPCWTPTATAR